MNLVAAEANILNRSRPLFALARKGVPEVVIRGMVFLKQAAIEGDDPQTVVIARSLLKPWQFLAAEVPDQDPMWALGLASHSGEPEHLAQLERLAEVAGASEQDLVCPRVYPLEAEEAWKLRLAGSKPSRLHHPCSGKHLAMLAACRRFDFPLTGYWNSDHPIQQRVEKVVGGVVGEKPLWLTDSCGLPTMAVSARAHLTMWEKMAVSDDEQAVTMRELWLKSPRLTGGTRRLDSDLMAAAEGQLLAKEGADGLLMLQSLPTSEHAPMTCLIKVASGYNLGHLALALWATLSEKEQLPPAFEAVRDYLRARLEGWVPEDQTLILPPFTA